MCVEGGGDWYWDWLEITMSEIETAPTMKTCGMLIEVLCTGTLAEVFLV